MDGIRLNNLVIVPSAIVARVDRQKINEYLLNREHPDNGGKAEFFIGLGFTSENWETLADALRSLAVNFSRDSKHGIYAREEVYCGRSN